MFDQLSPYTIPVLHPVLAHFPVALGVVSVVFASIWLVRNRIYWLTITMWLQGMAFIGGVLALRTGDAMKDQSDGIAIVDELVQLHESTAERALWIMGISFAWLIFAKWMIARDTFHSEARLWIRIVTFILVLLSSLLIGLTGHIGGTMVWGVPV
jgi:uncharacterized membrane protein